MKGARYLTLSAFEFLIRPTVVVLDPVFDVHMAVVEKTGLEAISENQ